MEFIRTRTVIIGAGISGVSTAVNLLNNGYDDFLIFEASDRIGGRCNTVKYGDSFLELGAQYIHGQVNNPIYKIASENGLISESYKEILNERIEDGKEYLFNDINGVGLDEKLVDWAQFCLYKSYDLARELDDCQTDEISLGEFIYVNYKRLMHEKLDAGFLSDEKNVKLIDAIYQWNFRWECMFNGCSSLFEMSLKNFKKYQKLDGCQIIEFKNGYKSLIEFLISKDQEKFTKKLNLKSELKSILLCHKLKENDHSECDHCNYTNDHNQIVLLFKNEITVLCNRVICTMSLGFLKENLKNIIRPSLFLPDEKLNAIKRMGFGTVNKIVLVYEKPFWDENFEDLNPIWPVEDNMFEILDHKNFDFENRWFEDICTICPSNCHKNVLIAWIAGNSYHESLNDDTIKMRCTKVLRMFFGKEDIPEPIDVVRSNWYSNPLTRGSYSFCAKETRPDDISKIAEPIVFNNRSLVQFAGEATHENFYSTVHGAYLTGIRESERTIKEDGHVLSSFY